MPKEPFIKYLFGYKPGISRWAALLLAACFTFIFGEKFLGSTWSESAFRMTYFWFFLIPMIPLVIHVIYPMRFTWYLIELVIIVYAILLGHREYMRAAWDDDNIKYAPGYQFRSLLASIIDILIIILYFYLFRPRKKKQPA